MLDDFSFAKENRGFYLALAHFPGLEGTFPDASSLLSRDCQSPDEVVCQSQIQHESDSPCR